MKKAKLFLPLIMAIVMMAMCPAKMWADKTAKAVFDGTNTLTFYYDEVDHSSEGTVYGMNSGISYPAWKVNNAAITTVVFDDSFANASPTSCCAWFYGFINLSTITGISNLNTENVTNMLYMFYDCKNLESLDVSHFNTKSVTDMEGMFESCNNLKSLNLSNFNTENVTSMTSMFSCCWTLQSLDLSNFNTEKVTAMRDMFDTCYNLKSLDLSNFDTKNVKSTIHMFYGCLFLKSLTLGNFDMQKVTSSTDMFHNTPDLKTLTLKAVPYLKDQTFNSKFTGDGVTVNYDLQLNDNSIVYSGENNLPAPTNWTAAPTYSREMTNEWGTIVVPFSITYDANNGNYKLYKLTEADVPVNEGDEEGTLTFAEYDDNAPIPAGTPMTIKATSTKNDGKYTVTLTAGSNAVSTSINSYKVNKGNVIMNGTYADKKTIGGVAGSWEYFIAQGKFWWAEDEATVPPFRAWFTLDYGYEEGEGGLAKVLNIVVEDEADGIKAVNNEQLTVNNGKFIENGKVVVVKNGKKFNVNGQKIR